MDAPPVTEAARLGDEPGEELGDVGVRGPGHHVEAAEELELQPVVRHDVALGPLLPGRHLVPVAPLGRVHPDRVVELGDGPLQQCAHHGEAVGAADRHGRHQGAVIDATDHRVDLVHAHVEQQAHRPRQADQLVAQPDRRDVRLPGDRPAQGGQRVRDVAQEGVGAVALHGAGDADGHRDTAQCTGDATGPDAVTDRLGQAVGGGNGQVVRHRFEAADRVRRDHELGTGEGGVEVGRGRDVEAAAERGDVVGHGLHHREAVRRGVHEDDLALGERRRVDEVQEQAGRPVRAPPTDDGNPRCHVPSDLTVADARRSNRCVTVPDGVRHLAGRRQSRKWASGVNPMPWASATGL